MSKYPRILIVDYGMGNLGSVHNALKFLGYDSIISNTLEECQQADAYILPGVGAFGEAMENLNALQLSSVLTEQVIEKKKPFLGICLGMQLIAQSSTEMGFSQGLGWLEGEVVMLEKNADHRLPHVGWDDLQVPKESILFQGISSQACYYFDHTFQLCCPEEWIIATCNYGQRVTAAIHHENIFATQFHPEKSQLNGLRIIKNYLNYVMSR